MICLSTPAPPRRFGSSPRPLRSSFWFAATLVLATAAVADQPRPHSAPAEEPGADGAQTESVQEIPQTAADPAPGVEAAPNAQIAASGLWIFIDPETGERIERPTPEQQALVRSFKSSLNKSGDGLEPFTLDSGGRGLHLAGRFQHALEIVRQSDGSFSFTCSDHPGESFPRLAPAQRPAAVR